MRKSIRFRRLLVLIGLHAMFVVLAARCGPGEVGHGTLYLSVPNPVYGDLDMRDVEFFLDEPVGEGEISEPWPRLEPGPTDRRTPPRGP